MSGERDLPLGHPSSADYDPNSEAARQWHRAHNNPRGERDYPVGHPGAADNPDRVEPTHPLETSRDYSRPQTVEGKPNDQAHDAPDGLHQ